MIEAIKRNIKYLHGSQWLSIFGLVLLFVALRWNNYNAPLISDEGEIEYSAQLLIQGIAPYQHAFIQKPPGVVYSYALANLLLPQCFWAPRLIAYIFVALATVLLGFIARLEFGKGFALPAMWLVTPMLLLPGIDQFSCNPEMFLVFPLLSTIAVYSYSRQHGHKNFHWFAGGFLAATTLVFKYTALPILAFVFFVWLIEMCQSDKKISSICKRLIFGIAGGILACVLELAFYVIHHALNSVWECTVLFNKYYVASGVFSQAYFWSEIKVFWDNWWILFLVPFAIFLQPQRRIWFWFAVFIFALLAASGSCYPQYYILIMPFWALLSSVGIRALASKICEKMAKRLPWLGNLVAVIVVLLVIRPDAAWICFSSEKFAEMKMEGYPFREAQVVADQV